MNLYFQSVFLIVYKIQDDVFNFLVCVQSSVNRCIKKQNMYAAKTYYLYSSECSFQFYP